MLLSLLLTAALSTHSFNKRLLRILDAIPNKTWVADESSHTAQMTEEEFKSMLMDIHFSSSGPSAPGGHISVDIDVPESYDYTDSYPQCKSTVFDQGRCGACWAFATTSMFSDRRCVAGKTNESVSLSAQYQLSCEVDTHGCLGGTIDKAWNFLETVGVPTLSCFDYSDEAFYDGELVSCPKACDDGSNISLITAGGSGENIGGNPEAIKIEIFKSGPVGTFFKAYQDFRLYRRGIYRHLTGDLLANHAVEIVGYGSENGTDFWRIRNSWGRHWGEQGFFRIVRGVNECDIEDNVFAGIA